MIVTEHYKTRSDGVVLNRTYSDAGMMIERDGELYSEAIDPTDCERTYTETDSPIPDDAMEEDYQEALIELGAEICKEEN